MTDNMIPTVVANRPNSIMNSCISFMVSTLGILILLSMIHAATFGVTLSLLSLFAYYGIFKGHHWVRWPIYLLVAIEMLLLFTFITSGLAHGFSTISIMVSGLLIFVIALAAYFLENTASRLWFRCYAAAKRNQLPENYLQLQAEKLAKIKSATSLRSMSTTLVMSATLIMSIIGMIITNILIFKSPLLATSAPHLTPLGFGLFINVISGLYFAVSYTYMFKGYRWPVNLIFIGAGIGLVFALASLMIPHPANPYLLSASGLHLYYILKVVFYAVYAMLASILMFSGSNRYWFQQCKLAR